MTRKKLISILAVSFLAVFGITVPASAQPLGLSTHSWDQGLTATSTHTSDTVNVSGSRATTGAWGTGPVNYQAGATTQHKVGPQGKLGVHLEAKDCKARFQCEWGSGTGYKGLVQFWNDPNNYVAFGLIHDPGVSPDGVTVMIEGASNGKPIGGYWTGTKVDGSSHYFVFDWTANSITWEIDSQKKLGPYQISMSNPSISFLGAAREHGDRVNLAFEGIDFSNLSGDRGQVKANDTQPYAQISAKVHAGGTGTGFNSMINIHDAHNNAIAFGIQADQAAPESRGKPWYMYNRVQDGHFTYGYIAPAEQNDNEVAIRWWKDGTTALVVDGQVRATIAVNMKPRLFFQAEGNARKNGDTVDSWVRNVQVKVGDSAGETGLNGEWNTSGPGFYNYGIRAHQTNASSQNGADFHITGRVAGLPANGDWDSHLVVGVGMIAQYWHGQ